VAPPRAYERRCSAQVIGADCPATCRGSGTGETKVNGRSALFGPPRGEVSADSEGVVDAAGKYQRVDQLFEPKVLGFASWEELRSPFQGCCRSVQCTAFECLFSECDVKLSGAFVLPGSFREARGDFTQLDRQHGVGGVQRGEGGRGERDTPRRNDRLESGFGRQGVPESEPVTLHGQ
jgi:hypothetical protein